MKNVNKKKVEQPRYSDVRRSHAVLRRQNQERRSAADIEQIFAGVYCCHHVPV